MLKAIKAALTISTPILLLLSASCENLDPEDYPDLGIEIIKKGHGARKVESGDTVFVHYIGRFANGKTFDSSYKRGRPKRTNTRSSTLIKGWKVGMMGMREGEKRRLTIPPHLGFGKKGKMNKIPPNAKLIFEVEMLKIE